MTLDQVINDFLKEAIRATTAEQYPFCHRLLATDPDRYKDFVISSAEKVVQDKPGDEEVSPSTYLEPVERFLRDSMSPFSDLLTCAVEVQENE